MAHYFNINTMTNNNSKLVNCHYLFIGETVCRINRFKGSLGVVNDGFLWRCILTLCIHHLFCPIIDNFLFPCCVDLEHRENPYINS